MPSRGIFIAATGQNVGKTTTCLGLLAALKNRYAHLGFMKPVGQQSITLSDTLAVDKDVILFKNRFDLIHEYRDLSPFIFTRGLTRDYLDGKIDISAIQKQILDAYEKIAQQSDYVVVEGSGHVGVGSIVELHNAAIAKLLNLDMIIVTSGGLGSAFDELALNLALCREQGVKVRGVILNRIYDEKREMILDYFSKALKRWNIPLLGGIPYSAFLSKPTVQDFEALFQTEVLSGAAHRCRHFVHNRLVAGSVENYKDDLTPNELIITPACREDIIEATLEKHREYKRETGKDFETCLILTGRHAPTAQTIAAVQQFDIPTLYAPIYSYEAMRLITSFVAKIRIEDKGKVEEAIHLMEEHIDLDALTKDKVVV